MAFLKPTKLFILMENAFQGPLKSGQPLCFVISITRHNLVQVTQFIHDVIVGLRNNTCLQMLHTII